MPRSPDHLPLAFAGALVLGLSLACGSGDGEDGELRELEIECIGMTVQLPLAGYRQVRTRYDGRCRALISDTISADTLTILDGDNLGSGDPNTMSLQITYGGEWWVSREGTLAITRNEGNLAEGWFDVIATNQAGERARLHGPMDWCDYGVRSDCPYQTHGGLTKEITFEDPDGFRCEDGCMLSECRVLIDRDSGGVQVDGRFGLFKHINVGHWPYQCEFPSALDGGFTLRSGGVDGPGTYGPWVSYPSALRNEWDQPVPLPAFELFVPMSWWGWSTACLTQWGSYMFVSPVVDETVCTFTIEEGEPGLFALQCADARHSQPPSFHSARGDFTLTADCDVRYTD